MLAGDRYRAVIAREQSRAGGAARAAQYQAQLGLAFTLVERWRVDEAIAPVSSVIDARAAVPTG